MKAFTRFMPDLAVFKGGLDRVGGKISEEGLLIFDHKVIILLILSLFLFITSVSFKLNGSSTPVWGEYITRSNAERPSYGVLLGHPKGVRSDEWGWGTPEILSQSATGYNVISGNVGYGKSALLASLPVRHYTTLFRPQFYGFFIFRDVETAFSFYWNYKVFGLFLGAFFLLMLLTENDFWLSLFGSTWVYFSSFIQWWFSTPEALPEMITAFCLLFIAFNYLLFSRKRAYILISAVVLFVFSINFAMTFYPPHQLPLIYLLVFLAVGYVLRRHNKKNIFKAGDLRMRLVVASAVLMSLLVFAWAFFFETREVILNFLNTAYPGKRTLPGGGGSVRAFFSGYYDFMCSDFDFPRNIYNNVCEASSFILFFPFVIFFYFRERLFKKLDPVMISLMIYLLFLSAWALFGLPSFLTGKLLLTFVSVRRVFIGIGIASIILTVMYLKAREKRPLKDLSRDYALFSVFFAVMLIHGVLLNRVDPFFTAERILFVSVWIASSLLLLFHRKKALFALFIITMLVPNVLINPVVSGLKVFRDVPIIHFVKMVDANRHGKWLVYGDLQPLPEYFKSAGIDVVDGSIYLRDPGIMKVLDPQERHKNIYNRTGYMTARPVEGDRISFDLVAFDYFVVGISPLSPQLKKLEVKYIIFPSDKSYLKKHGFDLENAKRGGLILLNNEPINGFWVGAVK